MSQGKTVPWDPASAPVERDELYLQAEESGYISPEKLGRLLVGNLLTGAVVTGCHAKVEAGGCCGARARLGCRASERGPALRGHTLRQTRSATWPWLPADTLWAGPCIVLFPPGRSCPPARTPRARCRASPRRRSAGHRGT